METSFSAVQEKQAGDSEGSESNPSVSQLESQKPRYVCVCVCDGENTALGYAGVNVCVCGARVFVTVS